MSSAAREFCGLLEGEDAIPDEQRLSITLLAGQCCATSRTCPGSGQASPFETEEKSVLDLGSCRSGSGNWDRRLREEPSK